MKVLGIMGSPRVGGNSDILLDEALSGARDAGAEVEKIILDKKKISGCKDCKKCNETGLCVIKDDMPEIHKKILEADAIIHSVPVYFWSWRREDDTPWGTVRRKLKLLGGRVLAIKPEYEDCAAIAREHGVSLDEVVRVAREGHPAA